MSSQNEAPDAPSWFRRAVAASHESATVQVDGVGVHYLCWGDPEAPVLVLVHGGAAHAHWWSFLAPLLSDHYRVVAVDLSGHGDSERRCDGYSLDHWAAEVMAVADHAGSGRPVIVGHSMGGFVALAAASDYGEALAGAVVLDSPVRQPDPETDAARGGRVFGPLKTYPTSEAALARFRTVPEQPNYLPYVLDHVARNSIREVEGGFTWKYDPDIFVPAADRRRAVLADVTCRVALFRAQHGLVTPDIGAYMYDMLGRVAPVVEIPLAGHHLMLDQPMLVVTALRTLLADWEHSVPFSRTT